MTKGVRLSSATDWRCDRAVVAAAHLHVTPQVSRPVTPSSLVGLSHNLLAQRTQSREAGPPKWRSASPRQAHRPPEVLRRRAAAAAEAVACEAEDQEQRPQRMAAASHFAEAVDGDVPKAPDDGYHVLPQPAPEEAAATEAPGTGGGGGGGMRAPRPSMSITPIALGADLDLRRDRDLGRDLNLGRDLHSAPDAAPAPTAALVLPISPYSSPYITAALVLNPAYVKARASPWHLP